MGGFIDLQAFPGPKIDLPNPEWETMKDLVSRSLFPKLEGSFCRGEGLRPGFSFCFLATLGKVRVCTLLSFSLRVETFIFYSITVYRVFVA